MATKTKSSTVDTRIDELADFEVFLEVGLTQVADAEAAAHAVSLGVTRLRAAVRARHRDLETTVAAAVQRLADDADADVLDDVVASAALTLADSHLTGMLTRAEGQAQQAVTYARSEAADTIAGRLHDTLVALLELTREVLADLDGITDADQAITAGPDAIERWARLLRLRDIHRRLRTVHLRTWTAVQPGIPMLEPQHYCARSWSLDVPGYGDDDGLDLLRFLARNDVRAWVPTQQQLAADEQTMRDAAKAEHDAQQAEVDSLQGRRASDRQIQAAANHHDVMTEADRQLFAQQSVTLGR